VILLIGILVLIAPVGLTIALALVSVLQVLQEEDVKRERGFEVILNTGETPVTEKKETIDHG